MIGNPIGLAVALLAIGGATASGWCFLRSDAAQAAPGARPSPAELAFEALGFGYVLMVTIGVVLADMGRFRSTTLAALVWLLFAALWWWSRRQAAREEQRAWHRDARWIAYPLALVVAIGFAAPVFDARLEARDAGVYRLTSARIDRTGGLAYEDTLVAEMSPAVRDAFFPGSIMSTARSMGFYLENRETGRVVPQFLPVAPVAMAVARSAGGSASAGYAAVAAVFLSALGIFFLANRLAGGLAAALAPLWLCMNLATWWFARYGAAEPFAQALILLACLALLVERETGSVPHGVLAGWALGLIWLTKLEMLILVVALGPLFLADALTGRLRERSTRAFWAALSGAAALFFVHAWGWARPYIHDVLLVPGTDLPTVTGLAVAGLGVAAAVLAWSCRSRRVPVRAVLAVLQERGRAGLRYRVAVSGAIVGLMIYGYWFRAPGWDEHNLQELGWTVSEIGLVLAVLGIIYLLVAPGTRRGTGTVMTVLLPVAALVLWTRQINPELLWAYRRFVPVVVPIAVLGAAVAVDRIVHHARAWQKVARSRGVEVVAPVALTGVVAVATVLATAQMWQMTARYRPYDELHGSDGLIRELAEAVEPDALVLVEARTIRGLIRLEGALQHELGRNVLRLPAAELDADLVQHVIFTARRRGQPAYLLTSGFVVAAPWLNAEPEREFRLDTSRLEEPETLGLLPAKPERIFLNARLYRLQPGGELPRLDGRLDIGSFDDLYLDGRTMFQVEVEEGGRTYRWTRPEGRVYVRGMEAGTRRILVRMASSYPLESGRQKATVSLDGVVLGTAVVGRGWSDYSFDVPPDWLPPADDMPLLEIRTAPAWSPAELFGSGDPRTVGVAVDLIRWGD